MAHDRTFQSLRPDNHFTSVALFATHAHGVCCMLLRCSRFSMSTLNSVAPHTEPLRRLILESDLAPPTVATRHADWPTLTIDACCRRKLLLHVVVPSTTSRASRATIKSAASAQRVRLKALLTGEGGKTIDKTQASGSQVKKLYLLNKYEVLPLSQKNCPTPTPAQKCR